MVLQDDLREREGDSVELLSYEGGGDFPRGMDDETCMEEGESNGEEEEQEEWDKVRLV